MSTGKVRVLACGSRTWGFVPKDTPGPEFTAALKRAKAEIDEVYRVLDAFVTQYGQENVFLIQGGAKGADNVAETWARARQVEFQRYPAQWDEHDPDWCPGEWCQARSYCVGAGPRRNQQMLNEGKPHFVVAFSYPPTTSGTQDMISRAQAADVPTKVFQDLT